MAVAVPGCSRMAVVSGCSLVAPPNRRMAVVWRSYQVADGCSHKQTSKQTYGGRMAVAPVWIWLQSYGGCSVSGCRPPNRRMAAVTVCSSFAVVWRSYLVADTLQTVAAINGPPNRRMAVVWRSYLVADTLQTVAAINGPPNRRMAVVWRSYQVAVWLHLQTDVWRLHPATYGGRIWLQIGCTCLEVAPVPNRRMAVVSGCTCLEAAT